MLLAHSWSNSRLSAIYCSTVRWVQQAWQCWGVFTRFLGGVATTLSKCHFIHLVHTVTVNAIIWDAQARSFLKCIKSHNRLHGCERCVAVAQMIKVRVVYLTKGPTEERRDEVFNRVRYPDHQKQISPLVRAGILCVKHFPLDYMHIVCLGAMKRLLTYLWRGASYLSTE